MSSLTHVDEAGNPRMVDVSSKEESSREAVARGVVYLREDTLRLIQEHQIAKGDVLQIAQLAGIMAAKKTADLIPLCHPLPLTSVQVTLSSEGKAPDGRARLCIEACVKTRGRTGVEMEALTAVSVAALCVYDMAKAVDREMEITEIALWKKSGGKSGDWTRSVTGEP